MSNVLIEFDKDVNHPDPDVDDVLWAKGTRVWVDPGSAAHYVKEKVGHEVTDEPEAKASGKKPEPDAPPAGGA